MDILLFDLDNTLYSPDRELFPLIDERINRYMNEVAGIPLADVDTLRRSYWQRYGVTMQGLMRHHGVDPEDYLAYVHDIDISGRLRPNPGLKEALSAVSLRMAVFTNSSRDHSERVLNALGIASQFEEISTSASPITCQNRARNPTLQSWVGSTFPPHAALWSKTPGKTFERQRISVWVPYL